MKSIRSFSGAWGMWWHHFKIHSYISWQIHKEILVSLKSGLPHHRHDANNNSHPPENFYYLPTKSIIAEFYNTIIQYKYLFVKLFHLTFFILPNVIFFIILRNLDIVHRSHVQTHLRKLVWSKSTFKKSIEPTFLRIRYFGFK